LPYVGNIQQFPSGVIERTFISLLKSQRRRLSPVFRGQCRECRRETKLRRTFGTLSRLKMPYLLTFGPNEYAKFRQLSLL